MLSKACEHHSKIHCYSRLTWERGNSCLAYTLWITINKTCKFAPPLNAWHYVKRLCQNRPSYPVYKYTVSIIALLLRKGSTSEIWAQSNTLQSPFERVIKAHPPTSQLSPFSSLACWSPHAVVFHQAERSVASVGQWWTVAKISKPTPNALGSLSCVSTW